MPAVITPGTVLDVHVSDFYASGIREEDGAVVSEVQLTWLYQKNPDNSWTGVRLNPIRVLPRTDENGNRISPVGRDTVAQVTIPHVMPSSGYHHMRAEIAINGETFRVTSDEVEVPTAFASPSEDIGEPGGPTGPVAPPVDTDTGAVTPPDTSPAVTPLGPSTSPQTVVDTPRPQRAPVIGSNPAGPIRTFATPSAFTPLAPTDRPGTAVVGLAEDPASQFGPAVADDPDRGNGQLAANDLWSGVESGTSIVDPSTPPSGKGSSPVGGLLLASGIAAMAGVAAVAGRRRLVAVRAID